MRALGSGLGWVEAACLACLARLAGWAGRLGARACVGGVVSGGGRSSAACALRPTAWGSCLSLPSCWPPLWSAVGAALARDVLFVRIKAATYALQAIVAHGNAQRRAAGAAADAGQEHASPGDKPQAGKQEGGDAAAAELRSPGGSKVLVVKEEGGAGGAGGAGEGGSAAPGQDPAAEDEDEESASEESEDEDKEERRPRERLGEPWLEALAHTGGWLADTGAAGKDEWAQCRAEADCSAGQCMAAGKRARSDRAPSHATHPPAIPHPCCPAAEQTTEDCLWSSGWACCARCATWPWTRPPCATRWSAAWRSSSASRSRCSAGAGCCGSMLRRGSG